MTDSTKTKKVDFLDFIKDKSTARQDGLWSSADYSTKYRNITVSKDEVDEIIQAFLDDKERHFISFSLSLKYKYASNNGSEMLYDPNSVNIQVSWFEPRPGK